MRKPNQNIELGSQPSNLQSNRPDPTSRAYRFRYVPQEDEMVDQEPQLSPKQLQSPSLQAQDSSIYSKFCRKKAANITIMLILCLYTIDLVPLLLMGHHFFYKGGDRNELRDSRLRHFQWMSASLKADPIMEIQIMDEKSTCPSGFQPLKLGHWPGTVAGCLCNNGDLYGSSCSKVNSESCKTDIPSTYPAEMYEWDDSIWCVKRAVHGTDYLRKAECPSEYKECYPGGCFKEECPITKLEIASTGPAANKFNNKDQYLALTRTQGELPVIDIQMTFGDIPCFTRDLFNQTLKNFSYPLSADKENQCDKYGLDSHFSTRLASQTAYDSFSQNSFSYSVMHLPYFEENAKTTRAVLSSTVRMKTVKHDYCLDIDETPIQDYLQTAFSLKASFLDLTVALVLFIRITSILIILCSCARRSRPKLFENSSRLIKDLFQLSVIAYIPLIPKLAWSYYTQQVFFRMKGSFEKYETLGCFEGGQGSLVVHDYLEFLNSLEGDSWIFCVCLISNVSSLLVFILYFALKRISSQQNLRP